MTRSRILTIGVKEESERVRVKPVDFIASSGNFVRGKNAD